jgi:uncharacterized protein with PQ loop repeat
MENFNETISWIFVTVNSGRVLSYLPQIHMALRCRDGARSISMATWSYFTIAHLTGALYSLGVVHDSNLAAVFIGNSVACSALLVVVGWKRWRLVAEHRASAPKSEHRLSPAVTS